MLYLIITNLNNKRECKQVCCSWTDATNLVQLYQGQLASVIEVKANTTVKLTRVSTEILKALNSHGIKVAV